MYAQNEQVHVAAWPSFSLYDPFAVALGAEVNNAASRVYAVEGSCFVLAPCATVSQAMIDELCDRPEKHALLHVGGGFAAIYSPDGSQIGVKLLPDQEGLLIAEIDRGRQECGRSRRALFAARRHAAASQQEALQAGGAVRAAGRHRRARGYRGSGELIAAAPRPFEGTRYAPSAAQRSRRSGCVAQM